MVTRKLATAGLLALSFSTAAHAESIRPPATDVALDSTDRPAALPRGVRPGSRLDEQRYAAREAASPEAKNFRGGDVIVISASALAIVLLVVLILILI